jgi:hypothetical protein
MNFIDFLIGLFLMNAMPHLALGIWKGRMFSAFGFGNKQNIAYSFLCLLLSIILFVYKYGIRGIFENGIYAGALLLLLIYFITGNFWYKLFNKEKH